jgi:hypothetical protein
MAQGPDEDVIAFDPARAEVRQIGGRWKVVDGDNWLLDFDDKEAQARQAFRVIRHYGLNQLCFVANPARVLSYYLVSGRAPAGPMDGEDAIAFDPARLEVREFADTRPPCGKWKVVQGDTWLLDFHQEADARRAVEIIRRHGFEYLCFVGRPQPSMIYFRRGATQAAATPAPPVPTPPVPAPAPRTEAALRVTVVEGSRAPAVRPVVTARGADPSGGTPVSLNENPAEFRLPPGNYLVSAHVGTSPETPPRRVTVEQGRVAELTISTASGTLQLALTAGGRPFPRGPVIHLRAAGSLVAAVSETPAVFQAAEGDYDVRVNLDGGQTFDIPGLPIRAGEVTTRTAEVPSGRLTASVSGGPYGVPGGRFPMVEVRQGDRAVASLADNPARFYMLAGEYTVGVREGERLLCPQPVTLRAGAELNLSLAVSP